MELIVIEQRVRIKVPEVRVRDHDQWLDLEKLWHVTMLHGKLAAA
jgi:hypothetical protein